MCEVGLPYFVVPIIGPKLPHSNTLLLHTALHANNLELYISKHRNFESGFLPLISSAPFIGKGEKAGTVSSLLRRPDPEVLGGR
jgi:hypothetical protein